MASNWDYDEAYAARNGYVVKDSGEIHEPYIGSRFVVKDSGARQDFETGARRDTQEGKPRFDLIPVDPLTRWANQMALGAEKYGENNWTKGMPTRRFLASALRHIFTYVAGDRSEDHLAAVLFNVGAIMHFENGPHDDINGVRNGAEETTDPQGDPRPSTYVDAHGNLHYVSVNRRIAQLSIPDFPTPEEGGAPPKCR